MPFFTQIKIGGLCAAAFTLGLSAQSALAQDAPSTLPTEHIVMILGDTFFPTVSYVDPGDTLRFVNASGFEQSVTSGDGGWSVGPIADQAEATLTAEADMALLFFGTPGVDPETDAALEAAEGTLSFDAAPLQD